MNKRLILLLPVAASLLLAACGGGEEAVPTPVAAPTAELAPAAAASPVTVPAVTPVPGVAPATGSLFVPAGVPPQSEIDELDEVEAFDDGYALDESYEGYESYDGSEDCGCYGDDGDYGAVTPPIDAPRRSDPTVRSQVADRTKVLEDKYASVIADLEALATAMGEPMLPLTEDEEIDQAIDDACQAKADGFVMPDEELGFFVVLVGPMLADHGQDMPTFLADFEAYSLEIAELVGC